MLSLLPKFAPWPVARPVYEDAQTEGSILLDDHTLGGDWVRVNSWVNPLDTHILWRNVAWAGGKTTGETDNVAESPVLPATDLTAYDETLIVHKHSTWAAKYGRYYAFPFLPTGTLLNGAGVAVSSERRADLLKVYSYDNAWNRTALAVESEINYLGIFDSSAANGMCGGPANGQGQICLASTVPLFNNYHFDRSLRKQVYVRKKPTFLIPGVATGVGAPAIVKNGDQISSLILGSSVTTRTYWQLTGERKQRLSLSFSGICGPTNPADNSNIKLGFTSASQAGTTVFAAPYVMMTSNANKLVLVDPDNEASTTNSIATTTGTLYSIDLVYDFERKTAEVFVDGISYLIKYNMTVPQSSMQYLAAVFFGTCTVNNPRVRAKDGIKYPFDHVYSQFTFSEGQAINEVTQHPAALTGDAAISDGVLVTGNGSANGMEFDTVLFNEFEDLTIELEYERQAEGSNAGMLMGVWTASAAGSQWYVRKVGSQLSFWWNRTQLMLVGITENPGKNHVAITREDGRHFKLWFNGVFMVNAVNSTGNTYEVANPKTRFAVTNPDAWLSGRRDNIRIMRGRAAYKAAFTPEPLTPIAAPVYGSADKAAILLQACFRNNEAIEEKSAVPLSLTDVTIARGRALINKATSVMSFPSSLTLSGTGDFTIELKLRVNTLVTGPVLGQWRDAGSQRGWSLWLNADGTLEFDVTTNGSTIVRLHTYSGLLAGVDYDLKYERVNGILTVYVNNVKIANAVAAQAIFASTMPISTTTFVANSWVNMELTNIRISKRGQIGGLSRPQASFPKFA